MGYGARAAAKTVINAVDAAAAPNPSAPARSATPQQPAKDAAVRTAARAVRQTVEVSQGLATNSMRLGGNLWKQVKRLSGVLLLEVTGAFFGLFAFSAGRAAWMLRGSLHQTADNRDDHMHFLLAAGMAALFGYFCVTSFLRARRKSRKS